MILVRVINNTRYQDRNGSNRHKATVEREDKVIVRAAARAPDSSLSTIHRVNSRRYALTDRCDTYLSRLYSRSKKKNETPLFISIKILVQK